MSNNVITGFVPIWEGLITDGSFQPGALLERVQDDLRVKYESVKYKAMPVAQGKSVVLQFRNPDTGKQVKKGCGGCKFTLKGVQEAAEKADLVTQVLNNGSFSWEWFERNIQGKSITTEEKERLKEEKEKEEENKSAGELLEAYKEHKFNEDKRSKNSNKDFEGAWYAVYRWLDKTFLNCNEALSKALIVECIERTAKDSDTRKKTLRGMTNFLKWCEKLDEYSALIEKYQKENNPVKREKNVPSDEKIECIFETGFLQSKYNGRWKHRPNQWKFLYALIVVYGIRIHEAWNIKNWDEPVTLGRNDWIEIEEITDNNESVQIDNIKSESFQLERETVIPSILDPNNKNKFLAIGHETKTGYRLAMPLSPTGKDWFKQFGLNQKMNLPDIKAPLKRMGKSRTYQCTQAAVDWFNYKNYGFTAHDLRHAYNHRGYGLGINSSVLAQSLGHSILMNTTTYHDTMPIERKMNNMVSALEQTKNEQSENEQLKEENQKQKEEIVQLKTALQFKDEEIERLRTELQMMKAVQG